LLLSHDASENCATVLSVPRGTVTFGGIIATSPTTVPGVYELVITPKHETSAKLNRLATIVRYEVRRASTSADEIEIMRRQMMREFHNDNVAAAQAAANALVVKYPRSAAACRVKGLLASTRGDRKDAIDWLSKARELLASGRDELAHAHSNDLYRALTELTQHIDALTKGARFRCIDS
jgi:hypothetical protein